MFKIIASSIWPSQVIIKLYNLALLSIKVLRIINRWLRILEISINTKNCNIVKFYRIEGLTTKQNRVFTNYSIAY